MPQATPARTTGRDRLKTRPSVAARGVSAENAPVLFRLPVIAMAAAGENAEPKVSPPVPPPVVERAAPTGVGSSDGAATISFPAVQASGTTAATGNAASSSVPTGVSQANAAQTHSATTLLSTRSWWEHWSSGVVLILLIIALVTASILALNDGGKSKKEQLASEPVSVNLDDFDLSNITIPDIAVSKSEKVGGTEELKTAAVANGSESRATKVGRSATLATPMATLTLPATANVVSNPAQTPKSATSGNFAQSADTAAPLASLSIPLGVVPPPLFDPKSDRAGDVRPKVSGDLPSLTASGPTASQNLNTPNAVRTTPAQQAVPGASPQLYDGAGLATELHAATAETAPTPSSGPVDTNLPSYATILASATQPIAPSSSAPAGQTTSAPVATQPGAGTTDRYGRPGIVNTATPELDMQAVINAYLPYSQTNQANNGAATNRFVPAAQPSPPIAPQTTQPGGRGFTLGN